MCFERYAKHDSMVDVMEEDQSSFCAKDIVCEIAKTQNLRRKGWMVGIAGGEGLELFITRSR